MNEFNGMPGPGDSMGRCVVCGGPFLMEIILGQSVPSVNIDGIDPTCFIHDDKCLSLLKSLEGTSFETAANILPDGPLRKAILEAT
jgi:hypothetical protein